MHEWMPMNDDMRLLREYATHGSEAAFATLVSRYTNLVCIPWPCGM